MNLMRSVWVLSLAVTALVVAAPKANASLALDGPVRPKLALDGPVRPKLALDGPVRPKFGRPGRPRLV